MRKWLSSVTLPLLGVILAFAGLEVAYRVVALALATKQGWSDRPTFYFSPPGFHQQQDFVYSSEKPEGVFRICILGDSFTYGPSLQFDDTFSKHLERMLSANRQHLPVEVHNHGHSGYSTFDELRQIKRVVAEKPDLILVAMTLNDLQRDNFTEHDAAKLAMGPYHPSPFAEKIFAYWTSLRLVAERLHNFQSPYRYKHYFFSLFDNQESWNLFQGAMRSMRARAAENNIKFGVVLFPLFALPIDDSYPFTPIHQKVKDFFNEADIQHVDLFHTFKGIPIDRMQIIPGTDSHPNEIAHRLAAESMYKWLVRKEFIPKKLQVARKYSGRPGDRIPR